MDDRPNKNDVEYQLSQYLDGQLSGRQAAALERRLEKDASLRRTFQDYEALHRHLAQWAAQEPDADYDTQREQVMAALERKALLAPRPRRRILRGAFGALAAAAMLAVAVSVGVRLFRLAPVANPEVSVELVAGPAAPSGPPVVSVSLEPVDWMHVPLAGPKDEPPADGPRGGAMFVPGQAPGRDASGGTHMNLMMGY